MEIWALADLHLSFGVPNKSMDIFGPVWKDHPQKIEAAWLSTISSDDLILIAGDISWAMTPEQAVPDLAWIDKLPGKKLLLRGNHDYWWSSLKKVQAILPSSIDLIQNNSFSWNGVAIGGARLWDSSEYQFEQYITYRENPSKKAAKENQSLPEDREKIFSRELIRLENSLKMLSRDSELRIAMTHYPPIGAELYPSRVSQLLDKYQIDICVFGHLHNVTPGRLPFGTLHGVKYILTSCDYLSFTPLKIA